jgi:uncharacterized protein YceH (UPF0502 family)
MLRGPQTLGELRTNASRLAEFADLAAVNDTLELLMAREPPLVLRLPREAGRREERFAHLLCGEVEAAAPEEPRPAAGAGADRVAALEAEVARLRAELEALWRLTGLAGQRPAPDDEGA